MSFSPPRPTTLAAALAVVLVGVSPAARAGGAIDFELPAWKALGPDLIHNGQAWPTDAQLEEDPLAGRVPVTGRINVVVPNHFNPRGDVWVGTATGGVWNGGLEPAPHWQPMTDFAASLAVGDIALDLSTCDSIRCRDVWVGTGENSIRRDTQYGHGVLKGTWDAAGGAYTWQLLGEEHFRHGNVVRVVLDPTTPAGPEKVVYLALSTGQTSNSTHSTVTTVPEGPLGIWKSIDGGASWQPIFTPGPEATDLEMDPLDPQILYAGLRHLGIYRSLDGGLNWAPIHNGLADVLTSGSDWPEIAVTWKQGEPKSWLYAVLGPCPHPHEKLDTADKFCSPAVARSYDGGDSWVLKYGLGIPGFLFYGAPLTSYVSYTHALTIHPTDPETLWYAGINLYKSTYGGSGWYTVGNDKLHPDHHDLAVWPDETSPTGVSAWDVNDGGLFFGDGAQEWDGEVQQGLAVTQVLSIAVPPDESFVLIGTQDNGANVWQGGPVWEHVEDGDSSSVLIDADDPKRFYDVYVGLWPRRCLGDDCLNLGWESCANLGLFGCSSEDNGLPPYDSPEAINASWYPPMIQEPFTFAGQTGILLGSSELHRSDDDILSWSFAAPSTPEGPLSGYETFPQLDDARNPITAIAVRPSSVNRRVTGFYDGRVMAFDHAGEFGEVWARLDGDPEADGLPDRPITSIAIALTDELVMLVSLAGPGEHSIYRTTTGGPPWEPFDASLDGGLAGGSVNVLLLEPEWPHRLWAGNDYGVYVHGSVYAPGDPWAKSYGLPNVAVYDLERSADGGRLYAATHGRGVWVIATAPKVHLYLEDCCGYVDLYDPQPVVGISAFGFEPLAACVASLFEGERLCGASGLDADGGLLSTDEDGFLVTSKAGYYGAHREAWLCRGGECAGGVDPERCALTEVELRCGEKSVRQAVTPAAEEVDPPSARLALGTPAADGQLGLAAVLAKGGGLSLELCSVAVPYGRDEPPGSILSRAAEALNAEPRCQAEGVSAAVEAAEAGTAEDEGPAPPRLRLSAESLAGTGLLAEATPGAGLAMALQGRLGLSPARRIVSRLSISGRATGGAVTLTERSGLGTCTRAVPTETGATGEQVALAIEEALLARPTGGEEDRSCGPEANPRDVVRSGASLFFGAARSFAVESSDGGLSITLGGSR